ncbi:MAG: PD-(D/E)XK nuclease family transposase, partial [Polyangiaceae bacterium]|nr:PD-(D/E)XK nuclease family transposase [Polyangiaceae bacterium]
ERNRDLLIALLNAVLQPARPIVSVDVVNPEIQKDAVNDRGLVLDILAVHDDKPRTDVAPPVGPGLGIGHSKRKPHPRRRLQARRHPTRRTRSVPLAPRPARARGEPGFGRGPLARRASDRLTSSFPRIGYPPLGS